MNHQSAIDTMAAERYMLAEMNEAERDDFEDHYFDCVVCTNDIRTLETMRVGIREALQKDRFAPDPLPDPVPVQWWRPVVAMPWAASMALVAHLSYLHLVTIPARTAEIENLNRQIAATTGVITEELAFSSTPRSTADAVPEVAANKAVWIFVDIDIDASESYPSYRATVYRQDGVVIKSDPIPATLISQSVKVALRPLPASRYEMVIEGVRKDGNRTEIARYPFVAGGR